MILLPKASAGLGTVAGRLRKPLNLASLAGVTGRFNAHASTSTSPAVSQTDPSPESRVLDTAPKVLEFTEHVQYWRHVGVWKDVSEEQFLDYKWQVKNTIQKQSQLLRFLEGVLPDHIPRPQTRSPEWDGIQTRDDFLQNVADGMGIAPMAVKLTPHLLSVADWKNPLDDPIRRQFIPMKNAMKPDHPALSLDSLNEAHDSPVDGLVHRYPEKVLFLATNVCPIYCRFCTRSYAVGAPIESFDKKPTVPSRRRWDRIIEYIQQTPQVHDVVVSGGDSYTLEPQQIFELGNRLLDIPHVRRMRYATKGFAAIPMRVLDKKDDWLKAFIAIHKKGCEMGKEVAMHTHFNHPNEITWTTELAARHLKSHALTVRNQTVLLRNVNDSLPTMQALIHKLANINITPYYVYQSDMIKGLEDLRTPLSTILELERQIRGTIAGFDTPSFIVDLPGGGGKRLANSFDKYDVDTGVSEWRAPAVAGDKTFYYYDPK